MELVDYLREFRETRLSFREQWQIFWKVYRLYERIDNLQGLIAWASRKRFKQRHYYRRLLEETYTRLMDQRFRTLRWSQWAECWYRVVKFLFSGRRYHPKGSAHIYRRSYEYMKP